MNEMIYDIEICGQCGNFLFSNNIVKFEEGRDEITVTYKCNTCQAETVITEKTEEEWV